MKAGTTLVILAIGLVIIMVFIWVYYITIPIIKDNKIEKDVETKTQIHTMGNALDAARLYTETALDYSIYQACYDNLKKGGWEAVPQNNYQGLSIWDSSLGPGQTLFQEGLQNSIKSNLNLYTKSTYKFLSDYFVSIPNYTQVYVMTDDEDPVWMSVSAFADSNMNIAKSQETGEYIRLEKDSTLVNGDDYKVNCYGVYQKGVDVYGQLREDIEGFLVDAPVDNQAEFQKGLRGVILPGWETENTYTWGEEGSEGSEYAITATILQGVVTATKVGATPSDNRYQANIKIKLEIRNSTGNEFPVYDGSSVNMQSMSLVYVLSIQKTLPLLPTDVFKVAPKAQKISASSLSFQSAEEEICENEDECEYEAECVISAYSEDGLELDEMDCSIDDPCCTDAVQTLQEDGWTVEGSCCNGEALPSGQVISFGIAKGKRYVSPAADAIAKIRYRKIASKYADLNGLPKAFVFGIIEAESGWNPKAVSRTGVKGMMQITLKTMKSLGWKRSEGTRLNPEVSIKYGTKYLKILYEKFNRNEQLTAAAYNSGEGLVQSILENQCTKTPTYSCAKRYLDGTEAIVYVPRVTKNTQRYASLISSGAITV